MPKPLITVIIPVYNTAPYLKQCLDSILVAQTCRDFRVLCCDDCSTDGSADTLARYAKRYSQMTVVSNNANRGPCHAINRLLAAVETTYSAFFDSDDIMDPERLRYQLEFLQHHKDIDVMGTGVRLFNSRKNIQEGGRIMYYPDDHSIKSTLLLYPGWCHATMMFRTASVRKSSVTFDERWNPSAAWDYDFYVRLAPYVRFANIPNVLYYYRQYPEQSGAVQAKGFRATTIQEQSMCQIAQKHLSQFNINASLEVIRVFCLFTNPVILSKVLRPNNMREFVTAIASINDFYGYRGVSSNFMSYLNGVVEKYISYASLPIPKRCAIIAYHRARAIPIISRVLSRLVHFAKRYRIGRFVVRIVKRAR